MKHAVDVLDSMLSKDVPFLLVAVDGGYVRIIGMAGDVTHEILKMAVEMTAERSSSASRVEWYSKKMAPS